MWAVQLHPWGPTRLSPPEQRLSSSPAPAVHAAFTAGLGSLRGSAPQWDSPASCPVEVTQPCHLRNRWWAGMETGREGRKVDKGAGGELRVVGEIHV